MIRKSDMHVYAMGVGVVSSFGSTKQSLWNYLDLEPKNYDIIEIDRSLSGGKHVACLTKLVKGFDVNLYYDDKLLHKFDRNSEFAIVAAKLALTDMQANIDNFFDEEDIGVCIGTTASIATSMSDFDQSVVACGPRRCDIGIFPSTVMCAPASRISILEKIRGANVTLSSGMNSGLDAIGYSYMALLTENSKLMICGGSEAMSPKILAALNRAGLLFNVSQDANPSPSRRGVFVPAEGACVLILQALDAKATQEMEGSEDSKRARICSYVASFSPWKRRDTHNRSLSLSRSIVDALAASNLKNSDIDCILIGSYFNSTDRDVETLAIREVFNLDQLNSLPILSFKQMLGESFAVYGAIQVVIGIGLLCNKINKRVIIKSNTNTRYRFKKKHHMTRLMIISADTSGHNSVLILSN